MRGRAVPMTGVYSVLRTWAPNRSRVHLTAAHHLQSRVREPVRNDNGRRGFVWCMRMLDSGRIPCSSLANVSSLSNLTRPILERILDAVDRRQIEACAVLRLPKSEPTGSQVEIT